MTKYGEINVSFFIKLACVNNDYVLHLLITSSSVWMQASTRKFHESFKALPCLCYTKINYLRQGFNILYTGVLEIVFTEMWTF